MKEQHAPYNLSLWAIKHSEFTLFLMVITIIFGLFAYFHLGRKEDPDFTFRVASISVSWPGATSADIQKHVVRMIEQKLQELPYLRFIKTYAAPNYAISLVQLDDAVPPSQTAHMWYIMRKKLMDIHDQLPPGVQGPLVNDEFGDTYIALFALQGDNYDFISLKDTADHLRDELLKIPGVNKVDFIGNQEPRVFVDLNDKKMASMGLSIPDTIQSINQESSVFPSGMIETPQTNLLFRTNAGFSSLYDLNHMPLRAGQHTIRLSDIAHVYRGVIDPPFYKVDVNGHPTLLIGVTMLSESNVVTVGTAVAQHVRQFAQTLPPGMRMVTVSDQRIPVDEYVKEFFIKLTAAIIIVLIVSFIALGIQAGFIAALSIPLVLALTFIVMLKTGISFQKISLGALIISLGLLVDDAMIAIEMLVRKLEEGYQKIEAAVFAYDHTAFPMLTGTLITIIGFLPLGMSRSAAGEYVFSLFAVISTALILSWIVAVYFIPYIGYHFIRAERYQQQHHTASSGHDIFTTPFYRLLRRSIGFFIDYRKTIIILTVLLFISSIGAFHFVKKNFFPESNRVEVLTDLWLTKGVSFAHTEAVAHQLEQLIQSDQQITKRINVYTTYMGGGAPRFYLPLNQQQRHDNLIEIVFEAKNVRDRDDLKTYLARFLKEHFTELRERVYILDSGPPVGWPLQIRLSGYDSQALKQLAHQIEGMLQAYPEVHNIHDDWLNEIKTIAITVDKDKAMALGLRPSDIRKALQIALSGLPVGYYYEGNEAMPIILRMSAKLSHRADHIGDLSLPTPSGQWVPLSTLATIDYRSEYGVTWQYNHQASLTIQADLDTEDRLGVAEKYFRHIQHSMTLPAGYQMNLMGSSDESKRSQQSIYVNMPIMVFLIFLLLMLQLQSIRQTVLVYLTGPLGYIGAMYALLISGEPYGFVSLLGVIALSGMIMRNSLILLDQIKQESQTGLYDLKEAIIRSTVQRFRPIIITALATIFAFIPLIFNLFWKPLAVAMIGGLTGGTILTIVMLPALCYLVLPQLPATPTTHHDQ